MTRPLRIAKSARGIWEPVLTEEHVVRELMTRLGYAGIRVYRINCAVGGKVRPNVPGIPDLIGHSKNGRAIYLEVKRPGGRRSPAQELFIAEAKQDGCIAFFADSWEVVRTEMAAHGIALPA